MADAVIRIEDLWDARYRNPGGEYTITGVVSDGGTTTVTGDGVAPSDEIAKSGSFTLQPDDNGKRFVATGVITVTCPAVGVLGNGFEVELVNESGSDITVDGPGTTDVTVAYGSVARILEVSQKQRVSVLATVSIADVFSPPQTWDPSVFGLDFDLVHWWDASTGVTLDASTGNVSAWADKIRSAAPTQTTAAKQPVWLNSDEIRFNGTGLGLSLGNQGRAAYESKWWLILFRFNWTAMAATTVDSYFLAINGISNSNGQKQPSLNFLHAAHQITVNWYANTGLVSQTLTVPGADDTWHSLVCRRTDDHVYASIDGAAEQSIATYPVAFLDSDSSPTGWFGNGTGTANTTMSMGLDTLLWGQRSITTDEVAKLHAWALWKRGAQASLDAGSPYLSVPPSMTRGEVHVAAPDAYADGYRFPTTGGWDDTVRGTALDLTGFTRTFHDDFTTAATITDGLTGTGPWWAPAHINTSGAHYRRPTQTFTDTYTILPDATTLQIKMQQLNNTGTWYSGHIQTVDGWRNGFSQAVPTGGKSYFEARMAMNGVGGNATVGSVSPAPGWNAFWLYTILDNRDTAATKCEIDVVEAYGDNANSAKQIHLAGHEHGAYRPQPGNFGSTSAAGTTTHTPSKIVDITQSPFSSVQLFDGTGAGAPGTFHTYGLMIDETWITWYFDGQIVSRFATYKEALTPLYMLISLQSQDLTSPANCQTYLWVDYASAWLKT